MQTRTITNGPGCLPWHEIYAWWPVKTTSGKYVWLRKIYKRQIWITRGMAFQVQLVQEYANLFEILEDSK